ncbi:hypothetical protein [Listeria fleischmannii]|nr:hypothetical protein [Listeria fleischmannii]
MSIMLIKEKSFQNLFVHLCEEDFNAMGEGATFQDIQDLIEKKL